MSRTFIRTCKSIDRSLTLEYDSYCDFFKGRYTMFDVMIVNPSTLCLLSRRAYPTSLLQQVVLYVLLACTIHLYVLFYFYFFILYVFYFCMFFNLYVFLLVIHCLNCIRWLRGSGLMLAFEIAFTLFSFRRII